MAKKVSPGFTECAHILPAWLNVIASAAQQNSQILQKLFRDMTINAAVSLSLSLSLSLLFYLFESVLLRSVHATAYVPERERDRRDALVLVCIT